MTKDNSSGLFTGTPVAFVFVLFQDAIKSNFRYSKTHCFFSGGCKNRVKYTVFWTFIEFFCTTENKIVASGKKGSRLQ